MPFPIIAVLAAAAQDIQRHQQEQADIRKAANANRQRILQTHASSLGGEPYSGMTSNLMTQLGDIEHASREGGNNNLGALLAAFGKKDKPDVPERTIGDGVPTIDDLPGAGNRSGLSMVDGIFGNESTDLGLGSGASLPATSEGSSALGSIDNLFGGESSKLYEDDPWGTGGF